MNDAKNWRFHVKAGRASGFPICCIIWFCLRLQIRGIGRWPDFLEEKALPRPDPGPGLVRCLMHRGPYDQWHICSACGHGQIADGICRQCGIQDVAPIEGCPVTVMYYRVTDHGEVEFCPEQQSHSARMAEVRWKNV